MMIDRRKLLLGSAAVLTTATLPGRMVTAAPSPHIGAAISPLEKMREWQATEAYVRLCVAEIAKCVTGPGLSYAQVGGDMPDAN